jgi:hypothetical protein
LDKFIQFLKDRNPRKSKKPQPDHRVGPGIFRRPTFYLVHSNTQIEGSVAYASAPYISLPLESSPQELGQAVRQALAGCRLTQDRSMDPKEVNRELLRAAKTRSIKGLMEGTVACIMSIHIDQLFIFPTRNGGTRGDQKGFQYLPDTEKVTIPLDASDEELGEGVLKALERCS